MEECVDGIMIHPAGIYSPERVAEFPLSNAVDAQDYEDMVTEVKSMGLNPNNIPHTKPVQ